MLCASTLATEVFIYPVGSAIFSSTAIPLLFAAIASVSTIIAMSSAIYLVRSAVSAINDKKQESTCNILEKKPCGNDISTKTSVVTTVPPFSPAQDLKEPTANNTKAPEKSPVTFGTAIPQVLQTLLPPPPLLPTGGLNNWKVPKDNDTGEKFLGGTSSKNSSPIEP